MRTVGVDLAAADAGTAVAVVEWAASSARLVSLRLGASDTDIVDAARTATKIGIDCALGWPDEFVDFVSRHADPSGAPEVDGGASWRRRLAYRETDRVVRAITGRWPLSVSTDRLGVTALRCAGLVARLRADGRDVDRAGSGDLAEVYPGASLRVWGFDTRGYRVDPAVRRVLLDAMLGAAPWLDPGEHAATMVRSGDAFDAVVAALATRASARGAVIQPEPDQLAAARREGWIALPTGPLDDLVAHGQPPTA
ncbi:DUF429 domain-containing protein [Microbacterium oleivorans]|uniref:DUF429 domain-containing protein n=1 Tax=Microbacterium oleivorans TaxID=273677 RepID=A0A7D5EWF9_9MICO|nr:DUF429 domain-containing protein [Microbacterium oleivorans]QLD11526.1 DUF429 domain-containing protein [Microbacterium oleivorans]